MGVTGSRIINTFTRRSSVGKGGWREISRAGALEWPGEIAWPVNINFESDSSRCRKGLENFEWPRNRGTSWLRGRRRRRRKMPLPPLSPPSLSVFLFFLLPPINDTHTALSIILMAPSCTFARMSRGKKGGEKYGLLCNGPLVEELSGTYG